MTEKTMRDEQEQEGMSPSSDADVRGLLEAAEDVDYEPVEIRIVRRGKVKFRFRIRPLRESEILECERKASKFTINNAGIRVPKEQDRGLYHSLLIYRATIDEDRRRLWDNKEVWERLNVLSGPDVIEKALLAGEKEAVVNKIGEISGFNADLEETAKN